jgi:hypothetical protein
MKKFYMILAAIAAMTMTAQAQTWGTIEVGDWENPTNAYNGSYFDMAPTNFYVAHTAAQMIYTPDMLAEIQDKPNLRLNQISFKFHCETFEDITRSFVIFIQETDATEFAVNDEGVKQFFPVEGEPISIEDKTYEMVYLYGEDATLSFRFNMPYTPGKGLLVTVIADAYDDENCTMGSDYAPFYTAGIGKVMTYTNNWTGFYEYTQSEDFPNATATLGCGTNVELPLTQFSYMSQEKTAEPTFHDSYKPNENAIFLTIENDPADPNAYIYYRITYPDGTQTDWIYYGGEFGLYGANANGQNGTYVVEAYAIADDKMESDIVTFEREIGPTTGIDELANGKAVAGVRYYNMAGQEMPQASGMTIVVTTYTDGTTSAAKVIK